MYIKALIHKRLHSRFHIYQKEHQEIPCSQINEEYSYLKNYLLVNYEEGDIVALYLSNEYHFLLMIMACQEIGLCYTPLKSDWPFKRIEQIKKLTDFKGLITNEVIYKIIEDKVIIKTDKVFNLSKDRPLYIIFTSGTNGEPKGVVITRGAYERFLKNMDELFSEINSNDKLINASNYCFDASLIEMGIFLLKNVHFYSSYMNGNPIILSKEISDLGITVVFSVPNNFNLFLSERLFPELNLSSLRHILIGGSKTPPVLIEGIQKHLPDADVYHLYGPTETTVFCLGKKLGPVSAEVVNDSLSLGKALPGCKIIVMKADGKEASVGETGELHIGGEVLMKEYIGRPNLTKNVFIEYKNEKFYKSGDIAFQNSQGEFFVSGRMDDTLKVSGHRVNLSDIDAYILKIDHVEESITLSFEDSQKENILVSFVVLSDKNISVEDLKEEMKLYLLRYQIPSVIILKNSLPVNSSGKINKAELVGDFELYKKS